MKIIKFEKKKKNLGNLPYPGRASHSPSPRRTCRNELTLLRHSLSLSNFFFLHLKKSFLFHSNLFFDLKIFIFELISFFHRDSTKFYKIPKFIKKKAKSAGFSFTSLIFLFLFFFSMQTSHHSNGGLFDIKNDFDFQEKF